MLQRLLIGVILEETINSKARIRAGCQARHGEKTAKAGAKLWSLNNSFSLLLSPGIMSAAS